MTKQTDAVSILEVEGQIFQRSHGDAAILVRTDLPARRNLKNTLLDGPGTRAVDGKVDTDTVEFD